MLFWILLAALAAIILRSWIRTARKRRAWSADHWSYKPSWEDATWTTVLVLLFGPLVLLFGFAIGTLGGPAQLDRTVDLAALRTASAVEGQFFLGSGTVDEEQVIRYIERADDGSALLTSIEARRARIYEDEETSPRLDVYCNVIDNPWLFPVLLEPRLRCGYYFHIPAGSVFESYEVTP